MMIKLREVEHLEQIYHYQIGFYSPCFFSTDFHTWKRSFMDDVDGEGRRLFKKLVVKAAYEENELLGFIQYGDTAFGFDDQGELSSDVSCHVIRNLYFNKTSADAGALLLKDAMEAFGPSEKVYAFFHYFGMSCFARHGKLFEHHDHIEALLKKNGFETEHENVYYSSVLKGNDEAEVEIMPHNLTNGNQQYISFMISGDQVGGCEVHYVDDRTAYLRWIYVNGDMTGKGIGTKCMKSLKRWLYQKGATRFDTDTATSNLVAQHYYEKNGFTREGTTRSYYQIKNSNIPNG